MNWINPKVWIFAHLHVGLCRQSFFDRVYLLVCRVYLTYTMPRSKPFKSREGISNRPLVELLFVVPPIISLNIWDVSNNHDYKVIGDERPDIVTNLLCKLNKNVLVKILSKIKKIQKIEFGSPLIQTVSLYTIPFLLHSQRLSLHMGVHS